MDKFFGDIYSALFENFYSIELSNYLWGLASPLSSVNQYLSIGLSMVGISLAMVLIFYYAVNHPRLNNWWGWLIFLGINAVVNFFVGWQWVLSDYYAGLMVQPDPSTGAEIPLDITYSAILNFGVANMLMSIFTFFLLSMILKWWSGNCSHAPF